MTNIKACIFDLDGVIVDTALYHYKAWRRLANELGFDFSLSQNEELKGISRIDSLNIILGWGSITKTPEEIELLAAKKNAWYAEMINKMTSKEILPGAKEFLTLIKAHHYLTALGSASKNSATILNRIGLSDFFDVIVDGNSVSKSKPDPEVFLTGAEHLGVEPTQCVVFEDAIAGIDAAKRGQMKAVGIGDKEVLQHADLVISGLQEMTLKKLKNL